jgi:hypothetical protein
MSPDQCSEARGLPRWCQRDFAAASDVPLSFAIAFEDGDSLAVMVGHDVNLREALVRDGWNQVRRQ